MLIQRYIFRQLFLTFLFTFFAMIAVFWIGMTIQLMRSLGGAWADFFFKAVPALFIYVCPWALLLSSSTATTLTYGRLSADNELNAIRTSGVHTNTILVPGLVFAIAVSLTNLVIYQEGLPRALFAQRNIRADAAIAGLHNPPPGKKTLRVGDDVVLSYLDVRDGVLLSPFLEISERGEVTGSFKSREARIQLDPGWPPAIILVDGSFSRVNNKQKTSGTFQGEYRVQLSLPPPLTEPESQADMNWARLRQHIAPPNRGHDDARAYTEYYSRFGRSFASVPLILLAIPLGMWVKKGSRLAGLGMALPPLLLYIVLMFVMQGLGERARIAPWLAGAVPSGVMSAAALVALARIYRR